MKGLSCSYLSVGTGANLVLLHGWGQSAQTWTNILPELSKKYTVYALDLPGFGMSEAPHAAWDIEMYADFVNDFVTQLGLQNIILLGHSFGGRVAYDYVTRYSVDRLILYSASDTARTTSFRRIALAVSSMLALIAPQTLWRLHASLLKPRTYSNIVNLSRADVQTMLQTYRSTHVESKKTPPAVTCPVTLIYGVRDWLVPEVVGKRYKKILPNATLTLVPNAGHFAHVKNPSAFLEAIEAGA